MRLSSSHLRRGLTVLALIFGLATPAIATAKCPSWTSGGGHIDLIGSKHLKALEIVSDVVSQASAKKKAQDRAFAQLAQQISVHIDSETSIRQSESTAAGNQVSMTERTELRSNLTLHSARVVDTCYDPTTLDYFLLAAVDLAVLKRTAISELKAHNTAGTAALSSARKALKKRQPLEAFSQLEEARERLKQVTHGATVVSALSKGKEPHRFATKSDLDSIASKAMKQARIQIDFADPMTNMAERLRRKITSLGIQLTSGSSALLRLRGSFTNSRPTYSRRLGTYIVRVFITVDLENILTGETIKTIRREAKGANPDPDEALTKAIRLMTKKVIADTAKELTQLYQL